MQKHIITLIRSYRARIIIAVLIVGGAFVASSLINPEHLANSSNPGIATSRSSADDMRAKVLAINPDNTVEVELLDGPNAGVQRTLHPPQHHVPLDPGAVIIISSNENNELFIIDRWRLPSLIYMAAALLIIVALVSGKRGLFSLAGLGFGIWLIASFTIPAIADGANAFLVCVATAFAIGAIAVFISHGMNRRAAISVMSIGSVLLFTLLLSIIATALTGLSGITSEEMAFLSYEYPSIDLAGVISGGIIIATLGMLDDVVTTQVAAVDEIAKANPNLRRLSLFRRAMSIGNEHIAALINTLALAYVGVALPMILLIYVSANGQTPFLALINKEFFAQEIVRTLVSSIALVLSVPVSTSCAALILKRKDSSQ